MKRDLEQLETELKKRFDYPYRWPGKQNNRLDRQTDFIYHTFYFSELRDEIHRRFQGRSQEESLGYYALNRWYNFWSSRALEAIFCSLPNVTPYKEKDRLVDFSIDGINFDLKSSRFPAKYGKSLSLALNHPKDLILWFYRQQSQERRKHQRNRLFLVLYDSDGAHWKLKAEIRWLKPIVTEYVKNFDPDRLYSFQFEGESGRTYADIIWAVR